MATMRQLLRDLPVLQGRPPAFDLARAPGTPFALFTEWLDLAIGAGLSEPHAMTLSTVDESGAPDARIVILKDADETGFCFAGSGTSRKGRQLGAIPHAALTFYWPTQARQIRVRGQVHPAPRRAAKADFQARSLGARALALLGRQSHPVREDEDIGEAVQSAEAEIGRYPARVPPHWQLYILTPNSVEFFQASSDRQHLRLHYTRSTTTWTRSRLWP
ncbi:pyridoxal 5'-phosphate synthase [Devosia sp.]|uniref:pyridoxine/pyridoxamine 5'-phosphate oxidase n=1 Tax=Devosia sp. TaxID=1871048 RepID=UPI001AC1452E|nr:pyridoxal 5'-phosphate synthase [Devosia sp.]MBN9332764.1 pyridoxal 5'-phosphate synthase [Devosia sp.]